MTGSSLRSAAGIIIAILIVAFSLSSQCRSIYRLPTNLRIIEGEKTSFAASFPLTLTSRQEQSTNEKEKLDFFSRPVSLEGLSIGKTVLEFKLLGIIPFKKVEVEVLPAVKLMPGGQSIGVILHSQGVIVVGQSPVKTAEGLYKTPAKDAGIEVGDVIIAINGLNVQSDTQVAEYIDSSGRSGKNAELLVKHGEKRNLITITPAYCSETKRYRIGLFVRDVAAGVGTLTFYEPKSKTYGALGHVITDSDTNQPIDCSQGKIVMSTVSGIQQGKCGQPGEKIGVFFEGEHIIGNISKNTPFGIYGELLSSPANKLYPEAVPVASMSQVQTGPAEILTVVDGQNIEKFAIEIQKVNLQDEPESKGMVIKVVDPVLLKRTGGIVQGMSGSPIMQNGKIVGAVTHVFVHDPARGYGCFVDWMLMESGLVPSKEKKTVNRLFSDIINCKDAA